MEKFIEKLNLTIRENDVLRLCPINSWNDLGMHDPHHCKDHQYLVGFKDDGSILIGDTYWSSPDWLDLDYFIDRFKVGELTKLEVWFNWNDVEKVVDVNKYKPEDLIHYSTQHGYNDKMILIKKGTAPISELEYHDRIYRNKYHKTTESLRSTLWDIDYLIRYNDNHPHSESDNDIHYLECLKSARDAIEVEYPKMEALCKEYPVF